MSDVRLGFVGVVVEDRHEAGRVNEILSSFGGMIRGRMGVPDQETGHAVIGLIVEGTNEQIGVIDNVRIPGAPDIRFSISEAPSGTRAIRSRASFSPPRVS